MAVLEKIRVRFGVAVSVIIALALLSFIIDPNTLSSVTQFMSSKNDVGEINGKSISYQDFSADIDTYTVISEMMTGSSVKSDEDQKNIRNQAWQALIDKYLFVKNANAAGIEVGEEELLDLTTGENVSAIIAQNFVDQDGNFSKEMLINFVQEAKDDESGRLSTLWNYMQNVIRTQQYYSKYYALFSNSGIETPLMLARAIDENNVTSNVDFVTVPTGYMPDSLVNITSSEIKKYYKSHKKFFRQQESRDIEYVVFEVVPSASDIAEARDAFLSQYEEFASSDNMKSFLLRNSERQLSNYWYKDGELNTVSKPVNDFVASAAKGAVSDMIVDGNKFYAVKVMDVAKLPDDIMVRYTRLADGESASDSTLAVLRAAEPMQMTQSYIIPGFEVLFGAKLKTPQIVETKQYGKFLAEVTEAGEPSLKKQVAIYEKTAIPGKETYNGYYSQANTLATKAQGKLDAYNAAVEELGLLSHPVNTMLRTSEKLGSIDNTKEITRWAFDQKKSGKVSEIITVNQNYFFVVACTGVHKEGYTPIKDVALSIRSTLKTEKVREMKAEEVAGKVEGLSTLEEMAEALGTTVSHKDDISFSSLVSQGSDPGFIGAVASAEEGEIVGPVAGSYGIYMFRVNSRETGSYFTEDDAKSKAEQLAQRNAQMMMYVMMEDADVKDNRAKFF